MTLIRLLTGISACVCLSLSSSLFAQNTLNSTGNVGINTTNPAYNLDVNGYSVFGGGLANLDPAGNPNFTPLQNTGKMMIGWNRHAGDAETDFINGRFSNNVVGGYSFWDYSSSGVLTNLVSIYGNGNVSIGEYGDFGYKLMVNGNAIFNKVVVKTYPWADYVFHKDYHLLPLDSVAKYIASNNHLPDMPSADSVAKAGIDIGANQALLLKKIEELTLYVIEQKKEIDELKRQVADPHHRKNR